MTCSLRQAHIDWFLSQGVKPECLINPSLIGIARGRRAEDGLFEHDEAGPTWFTLDEEADRIFWRPKTGEIATGEGRVFALGQDDIRNPGVTALGQWLHIHETPLEWLRSDRRGIVVLRWEWAFEQLRDITRIAVPGTLLGTYMKAMKPRLPDVCVVPRQKQDRAA